MQQIADEQNNQILQLETREEIIQENRKVSNKNKLIAIFKSCLNILRDNETLTGEKALRNLSYILTLKLIEPQFGIKIDIDNYEYQFLEEDEITPEQLATLLNSTRYSILRNITNENLVKRIKGIWTHILSSHPSTRNIFLKDKQFDIKHASTFKDLFKKLDEMDNIIFGGDFDILGASYEEVIKDIMVGKVLGQYFTQPLIKKLMVKLLNPQLREDGTFDTVADPTMGTGGFLISYLNEMIKQSKELNILLNTECIKSAIYGREIDSDTYQLAVSNMLISSGFLFENFECGDSIRSPIIQKYDNILANPPFGIKRLKYTEFNFEEKDEYIPIQSDNAVSLFIQLIIYMLKIDGKCAIVLPDGQDLFSKSNSTLVMIREYLLKTCDLQEVIYMPNGIFTNTGVKTCVFLFVKKREGTEVLTINKTAYRGKEKRTYTLIEECITEVVKFYNAGINSISNELEKTLLIEVPISTIAKNSYSLNYAEYIESDMVEYGNEIKIKLLGEVCEFLPKSKRQASYGEEIGEFPFYTSSQTLNKYSPSSDYKDLCLIIGTGGNANIKIDSNFSCSTDNFVLKTNSDILTKYLYYYLYINIEILQNEFYGATIKHISKSTIENIKIPIPSLDRQNEIVEYLDFIHKSIYSSNQKIAELKQLNAYYLNNQTRFGKNEIKKLGEVCKMAIKGNTNSKQISNTGEYPFYKASVSNPSGTHNTYCFNGEEYLLFVKSGGNSSNPLSLSHGIGKIYLVHGKSSANTEVVQLVNNEQILLKYLYYYLKNEQLNIQKLAKYCTNLGHIDMNQFKYLNISIPPLDQQTKIVHYCEQNDLLIAQLENTIESNKLAAKEFLTMVISSSVEATEAAEN
jgi:type I restriction enzyme M protein